MFFIQFFVGFVLIFLGWAMWFAQRNEAWKARLEKTFLMPGDKLFDSRKSYSIYVKWMRYVAVYAGLGMVIPSAVLYDVVIGMAAAGVFWWMNSQKVKHDNEVRQGDKTKPETA